MRQLIGNSTGFVNGDITGCTVQLLRSSYRTMELDLAAILTRIEQRLKIVGLSADEASRRAGKKDSIRNLRRAVKDGKRAGISTATLAALAPVLDTKPGWLIDGDGGREVRSVPVGQEFDPDPTEPRMVEGTEGRDVGPVPPDAILEADLRIGMGGGGTTVVTDLMDPNGNSYAAEGIRDWFRLPEHVVSGRFRVPARRVRCFEAVSDSMQPTVYDGDMVFVDIGHRTPSPPGIYALADVLGGVILKRLEISSARSRDENDPIEVKIISDNPKHSPETRTLDEISIVGRYLGRLTTF